MAVLDAAAAVTVAAPAKINLALHVTGRRTSGYHLIETLAVFAGAGDRVTATPSNEDRFTVSGPFAESLPTDDTNLVIRARNLLRESFPDAAQPVALSLEKNLPVASGIGGGSSDAAATLRALTRLWDVAIDDRRLCEIGRGLGADLPMCLTAQPLLARGVGDEITVLHDFPLLPMVLVNSGAPVATRDVFARLQNPNNPPLPVLPPLPDAFSVIDWLAETRNDLEEPAHELQPGIAAALAALQLASADLARMSGSGATCFGLYRTAEAASVGAQVIREIHPGWFVCATHSTASK